MTKAKSKAEAPAFLQKAVAAVSEKSAAPAPPAKASDSDRIDALIKVLKENGLSLEHHKELK